MRNDGKGFNLNKNQGGWVQFAAMAIGAGTSYIGGRNAKKAAKAQAEATRKLNAVRNAQARMQRAQEISSAAAATRAAETGSLGLWAGGTSAAQGVRASMLSQQARLDIQGNYIQKLGGEVANQQVAIQNAQTFAQNGQAIGGLMSSLGQAAGKDSWLNKNPWST